MLGLAVNDGYVLAILPVFASAGLASMAWIAKMMYRTSVTLSKIETRLEDMREDYDRRITALETARG